MLFWLGPDVLASGRIIESHTLSWGEKWGERISNISFASNMVRNHEVTKSDLVVPPVQCLAKSANVSSGPGCL